MRTVLNQRGIYQAKIDVAKEITQKRFKPYVAQSNLFDN